MYSVYACVYGLCAYVWLIHTEVPTLYPCACSWLRVRAMFNLHASRFLVELSCFLLFKEKSYRDIIMLHERVGTPRGQGVVKLLSLAAAFPLPYINSP